MKLSTTILSATLLAGALALAGCGGSSSGGMDDEMEPMLTPEEQCKADGGDVYEDGECKTTDDLRKEGAEEEGQKRDEAEAAKAAQALAKKLHGLLSPSVVAPTGTVPTDAGAVALLEDARKKGMAESDDAKAMVMVMTTQGDGNQVDSVHTDETTRTVGNTVLIDAANARHVMGSGFATGTNQVLEHNNLMGKGTRTVTGSYMGAMGAYTCPTADDCKSQRTDNGVKLSGAGWTFTPNTGQKFSTPDANYAEYGWWTNEGANANPKVGAWYAGPAGTALATNVDVTGATGSATYTGTAIGQAAYYHSQGGDLNVGGAFTADAELKATFGTALKLAGTIDGFDIDGTDPGWSVALKGGMIDANSGTVGQAGGTTTTWTIGGTDGDALPSAWSAQLYDIPTGGHQPTGVAGGFEAQYDSDGYMVGAFGAEQ